MDREKNTGSTSAQESKKHGGKGSKKKTEGRGKKDVWKRI